MRGEREEMEERPEIVSGKTRKLQTACGSIYVTLNYTEDKELFEVFCTSGKTGSCEAAIVDALTRTISISLRAGLNPENVIDQLRNINCPKIENGGKSCPDRIAKAMGDFLEGNRDKSSYESRRGEEDRDDHNLYEECPECGEEAYNPNAEGCSLCINCGFSECS